MAEQYFNLEKLLENQRKLDNKFKEKMGLDKIDLEYTIEEFYQVYEQVLENNNTVRTQNNY